MSEVSYGMQCKDAFSYLEDSLKQLELRENKLRSFPIAIQVLSHLESLDLFGNEIKTVPDDLTFYLQSSLKRLKRLTLNYINCTCDFGKTDFATWIRSHAIKGVTCKTPHRLFGKDISVTPIEEFSKAIAYISKDAFSYLEDSLKQLELRENKLRSFPIAIQVLSHLESLDLFGNEIKTVPDDLTFYLQSSLKRLKRLTLNYINCTCDFGKTDFATWIRSHAIKGVTCKTPHRLFGKDISVTPIEEFCEYVSNSGHK
ncbi:unnamed protein product [Oppiella nova]|uniref:Uncharacterized protein n=1 Tax=Oppiella nova TaxID=334625 RepID=A0A7R9M4A7_9ACAR|nr:unnamed protein product [Oppiella nova]CAG2170509.1 unnamed protein product [Oppiella nova]